MRSVGQPSPKLGALHACVAAAGGGGAAKARGLKTT